MKIEKTADGRNISIKINGRLDTTTAPALEAVIMDSAAECDHLTLDLMGLEYISSAGLRVLLKAQKVMTAKDGMILQNVNDTIGEIFEITGFSDILTIE